MKKRTKASQKRLNNLLILLLLVAVFLVMSTYAWFTANRTVNVDDITVNVATSSGLQISANGIDWKTVLPYKDIQDAYKTYTTSVNQLPKLMAPVSTVLEKDASGHLKMFYGVATSDLKEDSPTYGQYLLTSEAQTDKDTFREDLLGDGKGEYDAGYYMAFDLFLKDTATSDNLYFGGTVWEYDEADDQDGKHVEETDAKKGLENAARIAMIQGATTQDVEGVETIQGLSTTEGKVFFWEPNSDTHTPKGLENGRNLGWLPGPAGDSIEYSGVKAEFADEQAVELSKATEANDPTKFDVIDEGTGATIFKTRKTEKASLDLGALQPGVTKYRFYLWIEGQDIDCENNASGTNLEYNFKFSLDPITE